MRKLRAPVVGLLVVALSSSGCYTSRIHTKAARASGTEVQIRQLYALGGLIPLSHPAGAECPYGLSQVNDTFNGIDFLIAVSLSLAGGLVGLYACSEPDKTSCGSVGLVLGPLLLGSRTAAYVCAAEPGGPGSGVGAPGYYPPPGTGIAPPPGAPPPATTYPPPPVDPANPGATYPPPPQ